MRPTKIVPRTTHRVHAIYDDGALRFDVPRDATVGDLCRLLTGFRERAPLRVDVNVA